MIFLISTIYLAYARVRGVYAVEGIRSDTALEVFQV